MRQTNRFRGSMALILIALLVLSACSGGQNNNNGAAASGNTATPAASGEPSATAAPEAAQLEAVELDWYYPGPDIPADLQTVQDAVNEITRAKINATIKLHPVGFGDYAQKMNTVVASGEKADIIWTSSWNFDYAQNQGKGAFIPLDELIDRYAPAIKTSLPAFVLDATRIGGKVYAVPNYQTVTAREGFYIQKRFVDKYNLDINTLKTIEDIEPFLAQIKAGEPDIIPLVLDFNGAYSGLTRSFGFEWLSNALSVQLDDPTKVTSLYGSPPYVKYTNLIRSFYTKGYINEDAATLKSRGDIIKTGNAAVVFGDSLNAGSEVSIKTTSGQDVVMVPVTPAYVQTSYVITTMQAISTASENPERAMMFINLLNTDQQLFNTISYGVEGKHYTKVADNVVKVNTDAGYAPNAAWVFGNVFNGYIQEGQDADVFAQNKADNESAVASPIIGFIFLPAAVSAEIANITTVIDQYGPGLNTGTLDPADKLEEFLEKLKSAGIDKVVEEAQKQLDAFNAAK